MKRTLVIAEAGVNHNGDIALALDLVDRALEAGADIVKFQTFSVDSLVVPSSPKAAYQTQHGTPGESARGMLQRLQLDQAAHRRIRDHCIERGIEYLSTPFDEDSLRFLVNELDVSRLKLSSADLTNGPLLHAAGRAGLPLILSTGMANMREIHDALAVVAQARKHGSPAVSLDELRLNWSRQAITAELAGSVTVLQCTSEYPAPIEEANLRAIATIRQAFGVPVGYSDHTLGVTAGVTAVALGAGVLEKHLTLDRMAPGPDHAASLEPAEFAALVASVRAVEKALGAGRKEPGSSESRNMIAARRSLTAATRIHRGEPFTDHNVSARRPGNGLSPMLVWDLLGEVADREYEQGELIEWPRTTG